MPIEPHGTGQISIEFESRNVEKCNEFMKLFIVTANGESFHAIYTSISNPAEIWLFENKLG